MNVCKCVSVCVYEWMWMCVSVYIYVCVCVCLCGYMYVGGGQAHVRACVRVYDARAAITKQACRSVGVYEGMNVCKCV